MAKCAEESPRAMSTQNRLERRKAQLERELANVNAAIELFNQHPEISDALDLIQQISF